MADGYRWCWHGHLDDDYWHPHENRGYVVLILYRQSHLLTVSLLGDPVFDSLTQKTNFDFKNAAASHTIIAFVYIYVAVFAITWACVAWVYPPEIFSMSMRGRATSMTTATNWFVVSYVQRAYRWRC